MRPPWKPPASIEVQRISSLWPIPTTGWLTSCHDMDLDRNAVKVVGKGSEERIVPMGATTKKALLRYMVAWRPSRTARWGT